MKKSITLTSCLIAIASINAASAATITWDLLAGGSTPNTVSGTGNGNVRTFTSNGVTVTVTAWGLTGAGGTTFETAESGLWSVGMGICDRQEGTNCGSPQHQVDNQNRYEFMLFQFSNAVDPLSITLQPYGSYDRDVTYYTGNTAGILNLTGKTLAGLAGLGFGAAVNDDSGISTAARTVTLNSNVVNSVLFGARVAGDGNADYFKIQGMSASLNPTPEPSTYAMLGVALVALGFCRRLRG